MVGVVEPSLRGPATGGPKQSDGWVHLFVAVGELNSP